MQEINCSDPIDFFPPEVAINIFQYLKTEDLLIASLVSTAWYDFIAETPEIIKKINIKVGCNSNRKLTKDSITLLTNSSRKYENLEISRCPYCIQGAQELFITKKQKWRRVMITKTMFLNANQALDFFESIETSVEELTLQDVYMMDDFMTGPRRSFKFPKLKTFRVEHIHSLLFHEAFENIQSLQHFEISSCSQTVASLNALMNMLKNNHKLKSLEISNNVYNQVMYQDLVKGFRFKLKSLKVNNQYHVSPFHDDIQNNFVEFLKTQSRSLETLSYGNWLGIDALGAAFRVGSLKSFTVGGLLNIEDDVDWQKLNFSTSSSIVKMNIKDAPNNFEMLKKLTDAAPKLTCFSVSSMDSRLVDHMSKTHKSLRCLSVGTFASYELTGNELFKSLKRLRIKSFGRRACGKLYRPS